MKKIFSILAFIFGTNGFSQTIDSVYYEYDISKQELIGYVDGYFIVGATTLDITAINDSAFGDTVFIDIHYLPCQLFPTFTYYDTTFRKTIQIQSGVKTVKTISIWDSDTDTNSCYFNPNPGIVDTAFFNLSIPIGIEEYLNDKVDVYPNPVYHQFKIDNPYALKLEYMRVLDNTGKLIHKFNSAKQFYDISNFKEGLYIIEITTNKGVLRKKIIKK